MQKTDGGYSPRSGKRSEPSLRATGKLVVIIALNRRAVYTPSAPIITEPASGRWRRNSHRLNQVSEFLQTRVHRSILTILEPSKACHCCVHILSILKQGQRKKLMSKQKQTTLSCLDRGLSQFCPQQARKKLT